MAAVEYGRQFVFRDHLVQPVRHAVVRKESLHRRVELEAFDGVILDQLAGLAHAHLALVRIDAGECDHDVAVFTRRVATSSFGMRFAAELVLRIHGEHHQADLALAIVGDGFGDGGTLAGLEIFRCRILEFLPNFVHRLPTGHLRVRVHVDRNQIIDLHFGS